VAGELLQCESLRHIVLVDAADGATNEPLIRAGKSIHRLHELASAHSTTPPRNPGINLDLASLIYTSGSTGQPKGVALTHLNMVSAAESITRYLGNQRDDIVLSPLPLAFDYGLYQVLMALSFGGTVVLERQFTYPYQYIELIRRERVTGLPIVPTLSAILLNLSDLHREDFESVRYVTNTAQALPVHHIRRLRELMPRARLYSMYGLTECKRAAYLPLRRAVAACAAAADAVIATDRALEPFVLRHLGIAARFVSGYLFVHGDKSNGYVGGGSTHAWVRAYLPRAGWVEFDPTNGIVGNRDLVRVAVARDPHQAIPIHGTYLGPADASLGMDVTIHVVSAGDEMKAPQC